MLRCKFIAFFTIVFCVGFGCSKKSIDDEPPGGGSEEVTYEGKVKMLFLDNCASCHGGSAPAAGLDITTYENARDVAENGSLLGRINNANNPMPPSGLMDADNIKVIEDWAAGGYLQN